MSQLYSDEHNMNSGWVADDFKMTCHGLLSCDVTVVSEIIYRPRTSNHPFNPLSNVCKNKIKKFKIKITILQPLSDIFKTFHCSRKKGTKWVNFALLWSREKGLISDGLESLKFIDLGLHGSRIGWAD